MMIPLPWLEEAFEQVNDRVSPGSGARIATASQRLATGRSGIASASNLATRRHDRT